MPFYEKTNLSLESDGVPPAEISIAVPVLISLVSNFEWPSY